jgi:hypothetical protein
MSREQLSALLAAALMWAGSSAQAQSSLGLAAAQGPGPPQPPGTRLTFVCSAGDGRAAVYGTDVYTAESGVCAAAIHAGVLKLGQAGAVTIVFGPAAESFRGSERNGVTTQSYGRWPYTYAFVRDGSPGSISWTTTWSQIPADFFDAVTLDCPASGKLGGAVWGTDTYTKDSTICVAAVHAGAITAEKGGLVTVTRVPGLRDYPGTVRFGVTSTRYGAYPDAFTVTAARATARPEASPTSSAAPGIGPRTIQAAGFTLVGATAPGASAIATRTIQVAGFTLTGVAPTSTSTSIAPRTVATAGITVVGVSQSP